MKTTAKKTTAKKTTAKKTTAKKTTAKKTTAKLKETTLHALPGAKWTRVPTDEAAETYDILEASNDSIGMEELFGDDPEYFAVHQGNLTVAGGQRFYHDPADKNKVVFVVEGDLTIKGPLCFHNGDIYTPLWVRGSLTVDDLVLIHDACLFVGKSLLVKNVLVTDLSDAGHLIVHGSTAANAWVDLRPGRAAIEFAKKPKARLISEEGKPGDTVDEALLPELLHDGDRFKDIRDAVLAGRPILR
jgi:hypothetical protein